MLAHGAVHTRATRWQLQSISYSFTQLMQLMQLVKPAQHDYSVVARNANCLYDAKME